MKEVSGCAGIGCAIACLFAIAVAVEAVVI